jgi:cytochrome c oxidase subunit II
VRRVTLFRTAAAVVALAGGLGLVGSRARAAGEDKVVAISAKRFEFSPKEITLKAGETVTLRLTSEDVTHGFFSKPLGIDELVVGGKTTEVVVTPKVAGRYTTICDHFCGAGHAGMKMTIVVE